MNYLNMKTIETLKTNTKISPKIFVSLLSLILLFSTSIAYAQRTASVSGNWNSTATWG